MSIDEEDVLSKLANLKVDTLNTEHRKKVSCSDVTFLIIL
jgi:hypothetical protein